MTGLPDSIRRLLRDADELPNGPAKVAAVQQAAAIADSHLDLGLAFEIRKALLGVCLGAGQYHLMLVTFSWCLAQCDRDPERFPISRVLWEFRWVVSSLDTFPEISRDKIDEMRAEMARRYERAGAGQRAYWLMCRKILSDMGDRRRAAAADRAFRKAPPDWLSDGPETERGFEISYRVFRNEPERVLAAAAPFLTRQIRSDHFEGQACADVLMPLLRLGGPAEAIPYHRRGYKLRSASIRHLDSIAKHITFLALTDNLGRAVRLFEKHLPDALRTANVYNRMRFLTETLPLLDRLTRAGKETTRLRLPPECPLSAGDGRAGVRAVRAWMYETARELAAAFDVRNGNDYYQKRLRAVPRLQRLFAPCPLGG